METNCKLLETTIIAFSYHYADILMNLPTTRDTLSLCQVVN